jgi:hypothetical protein
MALSFAWNRFNPQVKQTRLDRHIFSYLPLSQVAFDNRSNNNNLVNIDFFADRPTMSAVLDSYES